MSDYNPVNLERLLSPDFDAFESFQEAVYFMHNEHTRCECPICEKIRGADEVPSL